MVVQVIDILDPPVVRRGTYGNEVEHRQLLNHLAQTDPADDELTQLDSLLHRMSTAGSHEELVEHDEAFHHVVAEAAGNATLASMLNGVSSRTTRERVWRGVIEAAATDRTISEHTAILAALHAQDPQLAEAAALLHVSATERSFASLLDSGETPTDSPVGTASD